MTSLYEARREKHDAFWGRPEVTRAVALAERDRDNAEFAAMYPHVGVLTRRGRPVYYVNTPAYRESADPRALVQEEA